MFKVGDVLAYGIASTPFTVKAIKNGVMWGEWTTCKYPKKSEDYWHRYPVNMSGFSLLKRKTSKPRNLPGWF